MHVVTLEEQLAPTVPPPPSTIPAPADKPCACGAVHDVFDWLHLALVAEAWEGLQLRNCRCNSTLSVELCIVDGCNERTIDAAPGLTDYCAGHADEWLMSEDREDFADEYAREDVREAAE